MQALELVPIRLSPENSSVQPDTVSRSVLFQSRKPPRYLKTCENPRSASSRAVLDDASHSGETE
jgi:hypothetical protein